MSDDLLLDQIAERRSDTAFMARLRERIDQDGSLLDKMAREQTWDVLAVALSEIVYTRDVPPPLPWDRNPAGLEPMFKNDRFRLLVNAPGNCTRRASRSRSPTPLLSQRRELRPHRAVVLPAVRATPWQWGRSLCVLAGRHRRAEGQSAGRGLMLTPHCEQLYVPVVTDGGRLVLVCLCCGDTIS